MSLKNLIKKYKEADRSNLSPSFQTNATPIMHEKLRLAIEFSKMNSLSSPEPIEGLIVFLVIVVNDFPNELIWRYWLETNEEIGKKIKFLIHAKHSESLSPWCKERLCSFQFSPSWGSIELTQTMLALSLEAYLKFENGLKFIFISESCLPLVPLETLYKELIEESPSKSWIDFKNKPQNGYNEQQQFIPLSKIFEKNKINKSDQWIALSRYHVEKFFNIVYYISRSQNQEEIMPPTLEYFKNYNLNEIKDSLIFSPFKHVTISDEVFFPTYLSVLDELNSNVIKRKITFTHWEKISTSPSTYYSLNTNSTSRLLTECTLKKMFFFRKIQLFPLSLNFWNLGKVNRQEKASISNKEYYDQKEILLPPSNFSKFNKKYCYEEFFKWYKVLIRTDSISESEKEQIINYLDNNLVNKLNSNIIIEEFEDYCEDSEISRKKIKLDN